MILYKTRKKIWLVVRPGGSGGGGIAFVSHFDVTSGTGAAAAWLTTRGVSRNAVLSITSHRWRGGGARVGGSWVQGG